MTAILMLLAITTTPPATVPVSFPRGQEAFVAAAPVDPIEQLALDNLTRYMKAVLKSPVHVVASLEGIPEGKPAVVLCGGSIESPFSMDVAGDDKESFRLLTCSHDGHDIAITRGASSRGLKRAVQQLVMNSAQAPDALVFGQLDMDAQPWIPAREWTVCPWEPQYVRGVFTNPYADKRLWIQQYSEERLAKYTAMMDWFGFSGCQLMETCYSYAAFGTVDAVHDWQKRLCRQVRANGQDLTLWAWAAEFSGFGWNDSSVVYTSTQGLPAREDPDVIASFTKYYDRYAELAPYVDRFIAHYFDPGRLTDQQDVFHFMRLLEEKLRAANPDIRMGMDVWAAGPDFLDSLASNGFGDYLLLIPSFPELPMTSRIKLHETGARLNSRMGVWGWYATEMETDQLAGMFVNGQVLKETYSTLRQGPLSIHPAEYWSEMDAHHINNLYSLYVAARLMWEPEADPAQLLAGLCEAIWGPANGPVMASILSLIEEVRSGPSWDTFWWTRPGYRLGAPDPQADLDKAKVGLTFLEGFQEDAAFVPKLPLPFSPAELADLITPHIRQIAAFAEFRVAIGRIRDAATAGASKEELTTMCVDAWKPVPEYGTWIGVFGTKEVREQHKMMEALAKELSIPVEPPDWLVSQDAGRALERMRRFQASNASAIDARGACDGEFFWTPEHAARCFQKLLEDGVVVEKDGGYVLAGWENWARRDFHEIKALDAG